MGKKPKAKPKKPTNARGPRFLDKMVLKKG